MESSALGSGMLAGILDPDQLKALQPTSGTAPLATPAPAASAASSTTAANDPLMTALANTLSNPAAAMPPDLLQRVAAFGDQRLFFQANNADSFLNAANSILVAGGDLNLFLRTAQSVRKRGDLGDFYDAAANVMDKGDYDDLRRFLNVTQTVLNRGESLDKYYALSDKWLNEAPNDYEGLLFAAQTSISYGATLDDFATIQANTNFYGFEGRNNSVDYHRILVAARKAGMDVKSVIKMMAQEVQGGEDGRKTLDQLMDIFDLADTRPDFTKFARIERVDSGPMTITEGESAALFCQAISSRDGLLPSNMTSWSSDEFGAAATGNYLDLSKLAAGTYHFVAKITGGGDTAVKTVIILPKAGDHDNGHGNDPGKFDPSNPGASKAEQRAAYMAAYSTSAPAPARATYTPPPAPAAAPAPAPAIPSTTALSSLLGSFNLGSLTTTLATLGTSGLTSALTSLDTTSLSSLSTALFSMGNVTGTTSLAGRTDISDWEKIARLYFMHEDNLPKASVYNFLDEMLGHDNVVNFLKSLGQDELAQQYDTRSVSWEAVVAGMCKDPGLYAKCTAYLREHVSAGEVAQYLSSYGDTPAEVEESLWLLGYRDAAPVQESDCEPGATTSAPTAPAPTAAPAAPPPVIAYQPPSAPLPPVTDDGNNGHGNDPGKFDPSNPGKSKPVERAAFEAGGGTSAAQRQQDAQTRTLANLKLKVLTQEKVDKENEIADLLREIKSLNERIAQLDRMIALIESYKTADKSQKKAIYDQFQQMMALAKESANPDERAALSLVSLPEPK